MSVPSTLAHRAPAVDVAPHVLSNRSDTSEQAAGEVFDPNRHCDERVFERRSNLDQAGNFNFTPNKIIDATLADLERLGTSQWCGYSFAWLGNLAARTGRGVQAEQALEIFAKAFVLKNSFHCNGDQSGKGYSNFTYRPFTLEGNFAFAAGVHEMLLQSHRGYIEIFPAIPDDWEDVSFENLRAMGGYLVSVKARDKKVQELKVLATHAGTARVKLPWTGQMLELELNEREQCTLTSSDLSVESNLSNSAAAP